MRSTIALVSAATVAVGLSLTPSALATAQTEAVFIGGTGTGYVPAGAYPPASFIRPFVTGPYVGTNLLYDGSPLATPQSSVKALNALIAARQGRGDTVVVVGLSKGAQVSTASMHTADAAAPGSVTYVNIGNPDRDGGLNTALGFRPAYGEVRFNVTEIYGEYDGFADWPDRPNLLAMANAAAGIGYVHLPLGTGSADDALTRLDEGVTTVRDNLDANGQPNGTKTTEIRVPTKHLPLTRPIRDVERFLTGHSVLTDEIDKGLRPIIDAGYSRNDRPKTSTTRVDTTDGNKVTPKKAETPKTRTMNDAVTELRAKFAPKTPAASQATEATSTTDNDKESNDDA